MCVCVCVSVLQCRRGSGASASLPHCWRGVRAPFGTPGDRIGTYCALTTPSTASGAAHGALCSQFIQPPRPSHLPGPRVGVCLCGSNAISEKAPQSLLPFYSGTFKDQGGRGGSRGWDSAVGHVYIRKVAVSFFRAISTPQSRAVRAKGGLPY